MPRLPALVLGGRCIADRLKFLVHASTPQRRGGKGWNRRRAAKALKISYRALLYKMSEAGLLPGGLRRTTEMEQPSVCVSTRDGGINTGCGGA